MIKAENGKVFIHGNTMAIRKEFVTIVRALKENLGEDALREDFDFIMDDKFSIDIPLDDESGFENANKILESIMEGIEELEKIKDKISKKCADDKTSIF